MSTKKLPDKLTFQGQADYGPRLFFPDLDGLAYGDFYRYMRPHEPAEQISEHSEAKIPLVEAKLQRALDRVVKQLTPSKAEQARLKRERTALVRAIIKEFEAKEFDGPHDVMNRKTFKDNLRVVLLDFLERRSGVGIPKKEVFISEGFELSGGEIGGQCPIKTEDNLDQILLAALVWKSRKTLGLLWSLAEQNRTEALLKLAQIVVPFAKALNEKAICSPDVLGFWPRTLPMWPVMKSLHRDFDTDHSRLLNILQVGSQYPFTIGKEARWTARDAVGKWAIHLCQTIEIMIVSDNTVEDLSERWQCKISSLGHFSSDTWKNWWTAAKGLLACEYIDVVDIPELRKTVKSVADQKSPGRIRRRIFQSLKDKFKSMASENKVK
jgi:hypothetical protein